VRNCGILAISDIFAQSIFFNSSSGSKQKICPMEYFGKKKIVVVWRNFGSWWYCGDTRQLLAWVWTDKMIKGKSMVRAMHRDICALF
jgi:hypothetical protein